MKTYDFKTLPITPGVYQFLDEKGKILYIGKAKNVRNRIKSYFAKEIGRGPAIDMMVSAAFDINTIETESEIEAILLEAELINKIKPKYNVRLRDDKSFLVIKITKKISKSKLFASATPERDGQISSKNTDKKLPIADYRLQFPCVELVRFKNVDFSDKSAEYFGPYPSGLLLKKSIFYLRKIFPFRDCSKTKFNTYRKKGRPCIYGDIRVCTAPCVDWVNDKEYEKNLKYLKDFLRGKKRSIERQLNSEMQALSKEKRYEEAGLIRNKLYALSHLKDVRVGLRDDLFNGENILFPRIECYDISNIGDQYSVGSMVVFTNCKADKDEYRRFKLKSEISNDKYQISNKSQIQNSKIQLSFQPVARELESRDYKTGSQIKSGPSRIYEMTNGSGSDLSRLKQVLERRFKNDWALPNLVVIDGGELQLKIAVDVLKKNNLTIPVVSIAKGKQRKKNEFHFSDEAIAKYVNKKLGLQKILIQSRDEAHRFAISYYRKLHKKGMFE